jgi:membrane-associated PAP2 superfamily phosphatase
VIGITVMIEIFGLYTRSWRGFRMKTLLIGIAFAVGMVLATQAFASDATDCPHIVWKHGHYVCVIEDNG